MASDFFELIDELQEEVGDGHLTGFVEVDQVYAAYQHNGLDLRHPEGGQALYLIAPLLERQRSYMQKLAEAVLKGPGELKKAMADGMEDLSDQVYELAPREFHDLRASGHPYVKDGDELVYDRQPYVHRLTEEELRAKDDLRRMGFGHGGRFG